MNRSAWMLIALSILGTVLLPVSARADAEDDPLLIKIMMDQLEKRGSGVGSEDAWDVEGWIGKDLTKLWIKTNGKRAFGKTEDGELQILYSKAVSTFWDFQTGIRHDFEPSPSRSWWAIGLKGLAPYFFEIDTALFIGESGHTALRAEAEYELLLTQRLVLTPEIEINLFSRDDPATGTGSGLSDIEAGLRLRYEIRREFAPYIGVNWSRLYGKTADFAQAAGESSSDTQFTIGLRAWF